MISVKTSRNMFDVELVDVLLFWGNGGFTSKLGVTKEQVEFLVTHADENRAREIANSSSPVELWEGQEQCLA